MDLATIGWAAVAVAAVAFLYSSVGHAGASGYIATLTLIGFAPEQVKPTALALNILVATIGSIQFISAGHFRWGLLWPFVITSAPAAWIGGYLNLPAAWLRPLVGIVLLASAARFLLYPRDPENPRPPPPAVAIAVGAFLGLLAGLTGTGGGIFLTPLLLLCGWAVTKQTAAVSALFILVNSAAGLAGHVAGGKSLPLPDLAFVAAAAAGGAIGSHFGSRRFVARTILWILSAVLTLAGMKLIL